MLALLSCAGAVTGCATAPLASTTKEANSVRVATNDAEAQVLNPGDVLKVSFPGAPNLDATQQIRRDGRINLTMVGEVRAAGKTPAELEAELMALYAPQLVSKEIKVTVVSSSFAVFVCGAVMKPGKISPERAVTALDAIMEAGGFDAAKADMRSVKVIRQEGGKATNIVVNLHAVLEGQAGDLFYLRPFDIVYVPEKFSIF